MPRKTIVIKNTSTHKFGIGKIAKAFGNMLKLNEGPDRVRWWILTFEIRQKCPKYMKILSADNIPQTIMLRGIMYNPGKCFSFLGFKLE